jgi:hypothetical protein
MKNIVLVKDYNPKNHTIKYYKFNTKSGTWDGYNEKCQCINDNYGDNIILHFLRDESGILVDYEPLPVYKSLYLNSLGTLFLCEPTRVVAYRIANGSKTILNCLGGVVGMDVITGEQKTKLIALMGESE